MNIQNTGTELLALLNNLKPWRLVFIATVFLVGIVIWQLPGILAAW